MNAPAASVMVDRTIASWFVLVTVAEPVEHSIRWGPWDVRTMVHGYRRKNMDAWQWSQVQCLPTIARLAREGSLTLHNTTELKFEAYSACEPLRGTLGDLSRDLPVEEVPMAIERSYFQRTLNLCEHVSGDRLADFIAFLLRLDEGALRNLRPRIETLPAAMQENLRNLDRLRELCVGLSRDQQRDAMHLWTAEVNNLDYFLTMDRKFRNVMRETMKIPLPSVPVLPEELLRELGIEEPDPFPVREGDYLPYLDLFMDSLD